jgi:hypothetical protein
MKNKSRRDELSKARKVIHDSRLPKKQNDRNALRLKNKIEEILMMLRWIRVSI